MSSRRAWRGLVGLLVVSVVGLASAAEQGGHADLKQAVGAAKTTLAQAIAAAEKEVSGGKVLEAGLEIEKDATFFEVVVLSGEAVKEVKVDAASGKVLGVKEEKPEEDEVEELAAVKKALGTVKVSFSLALEAAAKEVKDGKAFAVELEVEDGKPEYEVKLLQGEKVLKVAVDAASGKAGRPEEKRREHEDAVVVHGEHKNGDDRHEGNDEEGEHEGRHAAEQGKEAADHSWRQDFHVDKANWADRGTNPYFLLQPGYRAQYKHGAVTLTIAVLDETKVIDGVTTRIVEEREEKDGTPLEVSRNYLALDKSTGDLYYFGEDVDEYKDGKVAAHEGAWQSGAGGAKFGLLLPGKPSVGDKYYQESAPKVALDRAEIVSLDERIETPAGKYDKCLHVKESTPLEKGVSHKLYAPGIGLVKDDELVLQKVELPGK